VQGSTEEEEWGSSWRDARLSSLSELTCCGCAHLSKAKTWHLDCLLWICESRIHTPLVHPRSAEDAMRLVAALGVLGLLAWVALLG
jgi:hypothetical protein